MTGARAVELTLTLPDQVAAEVEQLQAADMPFLERVVTYAVTRRHVYRHLRSRDAGVNNLGQELTTHELRILAENPEL